LGLQKFDPLLPHLLQKQFPLAVQLHQTSLGVTNQFLIGLQLSLIGYDALIKSSDKLEPTSCALNKNFLKRISF
jgi:hypothetical protein